MLGPVLFLSLLFSICLYALWRGGRDERLVALLCLLGTFATLLAVSPLSERYEGVENGLALVDLAVLAGFVTVALTSQRFWPLWVAGLQLTTACGHGLKAIDSHLLPQAYGAALQFWAYPILIILAAGTWRRQRRLSAGDSATR
jgi:hypothetical protein